MKICEYIVKYLESIGISHVFGVDGANIEDIYDAIYYNINKPIGIIAKNETNAGNMANGYSRATNNLGVVITTSGGAALNIVPSLGEAYASFDPILAIIGEPVSRLEGKGVFQDMSGKNLTVNVEKILQSVASKYYKKITSSNDFQYYLYEACSAALNSPRGTSVILIPKEIQQQFIDLNNPYHMKSPKITPIPEFDSLDHEIALITSYLSELKKPAKILIIAGEEIIRENLQVLLTELVAICQAHIALVPRAGMAFDNNHPGFVGYTGFVNHSSFHDALMNADLVFFIGSRASSISTLDAVHLLNQRNTIFISSCNIFYDQPTQHKEIYHRKLIGNTHLILKKLVSTLRESSIIFEKNQPLPIEHATPQFFPSKQKYELNFSNTLQCFAEIIEPDANIFIDAGNTGAAVLHYLRAPAKGMYEIALGMGGMGFTIGAAIGACFANNKKTYIFTGDGSMLIDGLEIHTAIEYQLPIIFVIYNNNSHAMCYTREKLMYGGHYSFNLFTPSYYGDGFKHMFKTLNISEDITTIKQLQETLSRTKNLTSPAVLSLSVDANEIPPFLPFLNLIREKNV